MRITNNMMISNMMNNLGNNLQRMTKYQDQLNSGKKIQLPSDDPVIAARALKLRTDVAQNEQYQRNISDAQSWLDLTEGTLGGMGSVLQRVRELAVQAATGSNTPDETKKISVEISQLKTQITHMANTTYAGRYIFSGFKTDQKLIDDDESSPNFGKSRLDVNTVNERIFYEVGIGDSINVNVAGGDLFNMEGDIANSINGNVKADIKTLAYPLTLDASNSDVSISVDGLTPPINVNIAGTYNDEASLSAAIENAVNTEIATRNAALPAGSTPTQPIAVSISGNKLAITSGSKGAASSIEITSPQSSFFANINTTNVVAEAGNAGEVPSMIKCFDDLITALNTGDNKAVSGMLDEIDNQVNNVLRVRADVGARQNRLDLTANRAEDDNINFTKLMSLNEDADMAETIMNLKNEENVYNASLAGGARIIQPSLVDFLK